MGRDIYNAGPPPDITFGWEFVLDLYGCNKVTISDEKAIKDFTLELCKVIDMKPCGESLTAYFVENKENKKAYSLLLFIGTGSITGHFSKSAGAVYLNIFSIREYDIEKAENFCKEYFDAESVRSRFIIRK